MEPLDDKLRAQSISDFMHALYGAKPADQHILLWRKEGKLSAWFTEPAAAAAYAAAHPTNIYSGVGLSPAAYGPKLRCKADDIAAMVALPADIDLLGDAHKSKALPQSDEHALKLLPKTFPASMIIQSGHGLQAWWILRAPWVFADAEDRKRGQDLALRWDRYLKMRAARLGFTIDSVYDLSRIMRVPGTMNVKDGLPPAQAYIQSLTDIRYDLADFEKLLAAAAPAPPPIAASAPATGPKLVKPSIMPRPVGEIQYDPNAVIHPAIFAALYANDMTFRLTWGGLRSDFKGDQSQSAYDLALANLMYDAGVPDQEAANALVHHRRLRNQQMKPQPVYYLTRTLGQARERLKSLPAQKELAASIAAMLEGTIEQDAAGLPALQAIEALVKPKPATPTVRMIGADGSIPITTLAQRAAALGEFNIAIELRIDDVLTAVVKAVRIPAGNDTTWRLDLANGEMVKFDRETDWSIYDRFAGEIRTQVNGIIAIPNKKADWQRKVIPKLQMAFVTETAEQGDFRSQTEDLIDNYLATRGVWTREYAYREARCNGLPFPYKRAEDEAELISVYVQDILEWLLRARGEKRLPREITAGLYAVGAEPVGINRDRRTTQRRYLLPPKWIADDYRKAQRDDIAGAEAGLPADGDTPPEVKTWQN